MFANHRLDPIITNIQLLKYQLDELPSCKELVDTVAGLLVVGHLD